MATESGENKYNKYGQPALDFIFTGTKKSLKDRSGNRQLEFTRNSVGTYVDENGVIQSAASGAARFDHDPVTNESLGLLVEESRTNSVTYSSQMLQAFTATEVNVTPNAGLAPDGTNTAVKIAATTAANYHSYKDAVASASLRTLSLYVKSAGENTVYLGIYEYIGQGTTVDLSAGTASGGGTITPVGNGWYRISYTVDYSLRKNFIIMPGGRNQNAGDGTSGILVWGPQLESGASFPTSYIPTLATFTSRASTATYYDANGIIQTAAIDEARDDAYFPDENGNFVSAGLLLEGSGTNYYTYSQDFTGWSSYGIEPVTSNSTTAPDGTLTADLVTLSSGATDAYVFVGVTVPDPSVVSVFLKSNGWDYVGIWMNNYDGSSDAKVAVNLADGSVIATANAGGYGVQELANGWYRVWLTSTTGADGTVSFRAFNSSGSLIFDPANGTDGFYIWGAQSETGTHPTSYIPTAGSTVTRAADVSSSSTVTRAADVATLTNNNIYNTEAFTIINEPFGVSAGSTSLSLVGPNINIKRTTVYSTNLSQTNILNFKKKTDEFWRWRILGSSFGLPNFTTDGQVTVDWGDGTVETLTTSDHTFTNGGGYHEIGFRLDTGTYFRPYIDNNTSHDTKVVAVGPAPGSMALDGWRAFYGCTNLKAFDATVDATGGTNFQFSWRSCTNLTSFPLIDTSSGTNFYQTWYDCPSLTSFPSINTSNGTTFYQAWYNCTSLTSFPLIDTSSGTNFTGAWRDCNSLTSFPLINTSSGTSFTDAWRNCTSLTSFPLIDTSSGTTFYLSWYACSNLTSFPLINMSSGTNFRQTWELCTSLTSFPAINMSSGTTFYQAWKNCSSLTSFSAVDVSSGESFFEAWSGCSSLTSFPLINMSSGINFQETWQNCSSLTSFPAINMSSGTTFYQAWQNCSSLTSFSVINVAAGENFIETWRACSGLTSFPVIDMPSGTTFFRTWRDCTGLTSFPLIDTSSGTSFSEAWYNCSSLTDFPANFFDSWTGTPANNCFVNTWNNCPSLTATSVENILNSIDTSGQSAPASGVDITIDYNAGSGTPNISTAVTNLKSRGWTITLNGAAQ